MKANVLNFITVVLIAVASSFQSQATEFEGVDRDNSTPPATTESTSDPQEIVVTSDTIPPPTEPATPSTTAATSKPKKLPKYSSRGPVANPENREVINRWREGMRNRRAALQKMGENGSLTAEEMAQLGEEFRKLDREIEKLAKSKEKLTQAQRNKMVKMSTNFRDKRLNKQFNNSFDGNMTRDRLSKMNKNGVKRTKDKYKEFRQNKDIDPEDARAVRDIRDEMQAVIDKAKSEGDTPSVATQQELARLRAEFNASMKRAENRAERASEQNSGTESKQADNRHVSRGYRRQ